jgi:hypothetical protein
MSAKHTPTFLTGWEVSREKESGNEFFQITAHIYDDKVGPVLDTMNCHHCLTTEDEEKIARLASAAPALVEALTKLIIEFDDMDEHRPLHAGCIQCTEGATPDRYNTGPCAYHAAKAVIATADGTNGGAL